MNTPTPNPYEAPRASVFDAVPDQGTYSLIPNGQSVSAGEGLTWITDAFSLFARSWVNWVVMGVIFMLGFFVLAFIPFIGAIAQILLMPVVAGGLMLACKAQDEGQPVEINHLFAGFQDHAAPLMIVGAVYFGAVMIIMIVMGILMAVVIGGGALMGLMGGGSSDMAGFAVIPVVLLILVTMALTIPVVMAYWFAPPLVVFHGLKPIDAMKQSFFGCLKNVVPFLLYGIVLMVIGILAMLPLLLGLLVVFPVAMISMYTAYRSIFVAK